MAADILGYPQPGTNAKKVPISFMQEKDDLIEMAVAHCHYLKSGNIPYAETRFAPQYSEEDRPGVV